MTDNFDKEIENDGCTIPSISPTEEIETSNDIGDVTVDIEEPTKEPDKENEEAAILKRYNLEKEAIDKKNEELKEREAEMAKEIVREREIRDNMVLGDNPVSPERAEADADAIYSMGEDLEEKRVELLKLEEEIKKNSSVSSQIGIANQLEAKIASSDNPEQIEHYREMEEKLMARIEKTKLDNE